MGEQKRLKILFRVLKEGFSAKLEYQSAGASGIDLRAAIDGPIELAPFEWKAIPTGIALSIPPGFEGQVRPRSGLALKHGVTLLNSPGTIDSDYRGEIKVILINLSRTTYEVQPGERIAQLVFAPVAKADLVEVERLDDTERGEGGFGSTGKY